MKPLSFKYYFLLLLIPEDIFPIDSSRVGERETHTHRNINERKRDTWIGCRGPACKPGLYPQQEWNLSTEQPARALPLFCRTSFELFAGHFGDAL